MNKVEKEISWTRYGVGYTRWWRWLVVWPRLFGTDLQVTGLTSKWVLFCVLK